MATFDASAACLDLEIDIELDDLSIRFPGGATLKIPSPPGLDIAVAGDYGKQILASASAALMPLQPIFNIIELLLVVVEFAQAVPDSLGPPPDPTKVIALIPKLKKKLDKLLAMIPPLSIPAFVKDILRVILVFLKGLRANLSAAATLNLAIDAGRARVGELDALAAQGLISLDVGLALSASIDCAEISVGAMLAGMAQGAAPLETLLGIIRAFIQLVGLPFEIPTMASLGGSVTVAIDAIDALILVLGTVQVAIVI